MKLFNPDQLAELQAPLNSDNVKSRKQSGRDLSYIEGWKAIEEANRIFGFDAWTRETFDVKCVADDQRKIGKDKRDGWGVSYIAKVRVIVAGTITREGIGAGHGIDADRGLAHESAIKEAETDAMKRAMMTFGNPFGLALYDKAQANVKRLPKKDARDVYERLQREIDAETDLAALRQWGEENRDRIAVLPEDWQDILRSRFHEKLVLLRQHPTEAEVTRPEPRDALEEIWDSETPPEWSDGFESFSPKKQAGILCGDEGFWKFLNESALVHVTVTGPDSAAAYVREFCGVKSRKELDTDPVAVRKWRGLVADYRGWQREPSVTESPARTSPPTPSAGERADEPASPPESSAQPIPTWEEYTERWMLIISQAHKADQLIAEWNAQRALRKSIPYADPQNLYGQLKDSVHAAIDRLKS